MTRAEQCKGDFDRLRHLFWRYLGWEERLKVLTDVGVIPNTANRLIPQTFERAALETAYKAGKLYDDLKAACPNGVDAYFENVGGGILDALLRLMNVRSRITVCGLISEYNAAEPYGVKMFRSILVNRIKVQGMIVFDWLERYPEANQALLDLVVSGKLKYRESVLEGIENAPKGLIGLLKGQNFGKQLVKLS